VVRAWPDDSHFAPAPPPRGRARVRLSGIAGVVLVVAGAGAIAVAVLAQQHAPSPASSAAGAVGAAAKGPSLGRSVPVSVSIPQIGVRSKLLSLGLNPDGSIAVPSLATSADEAAWYKYSVTPGQVGAAVIEGHVDSYQGPAVFFRLGALRPGNQIDVTLADGITQVQIGGDIIVSVDGQPISSDNALAAVVLHDRPGQKIKVGIVRGTKHLTVTVALGTRPESLPSSG